MRLAVSPEIDELHRGIQVWCDPVLPCLDDLAERPDIALLHPRCLMDALLYDFLETTKPSPFAVPVDTDMLLRSTMRGMQQ